MIIELPNSRTAENGKSDSRRFAFEQLLVIGFFILFTKIFDAGSAVVAVAYDPEIFENDSEDKPNAGKKYSDAAECVPEKRHFYYCLYWNEKVIPRTDFLQVSYLLVRINCSILFQPVTGLQHENREFRFAVPCGSCPAAGDGSVFFP